MKKWNFFFVLNILMLLIVALCFYSVTEMTKSRYRSNEPTWAIFFAMGIFGVIGINSILNIIWHFRLLPDRVMPKPSLVLFYFFYVLNVIATIIFGIGVYQVLSVTLTADLATQNKAVSFITLFFWLIHLAIVILQPTLPGYLKKRSQEDMSDLIQSLGEEPRL